MKNQYFGDVSDYRKYGLLRCVVEATDSRLGVVWLLTRDDKSRDGGFVDYLRQGSRFKPFDPVLFDTLSDVKKRNGGCSVSVLRHSKLFPSGLVSFEPFVEDSAPSRDVYFRDALAEISACPVVFFDPDNGIEVKSVKRGKTRSSKYVYWEELEVTHNAGHSLVVYQHWQRRPRAEQIAWLEEEIARRFGGASASFVESSHVLFILIPTPAHARTLTEGARLAASRWPGQLALRDGQRGGAKS